MAHPSQLWIDRARKVPPGLDAFAPARVMVHALRTRQISALELLEMHISRIERYNPALNAVVTADYERARQGASAADGARARGEDGALLGLPLTIKDCLYTQGLPTTGGLPERANAVAETDAPAVARIRAAGAIVMGKTNVPPYAADWQTANPLFGRTNNPWDLHRTPGGSTGGGATALAAGLTPLEFGGDLGGSIRVPAAFCGVYAHKPSETAVPGTGHFPDPPTTPNLAAAMAVQGPLARTAEDLELALDVIAGPDVGEDLAWRIALPPPRHARLAEYRVAVLPHPPWLPVDNEIRAALQRLTDQLGRAGVCIREAQPDLFGDLRRYYRLYRVLVSVLVHVSLTQAERRAKAEELKPARGDEFIAAWADGLSLSARKYVDMSNQRQAYRIACRIFFRDWDVLLTPANIVNAFPHTAAPWMERRLAVNEQLVRYDLQGVYPGLANLTGQPATVFPVGRTHAGLPIGLQAIGPYLEDRTTIRFAALVAREFGGFVPPRGHDGAGLYPAIASTPAAASD